MEFKQWLDMRYTEQAASYRLQLLTITRTVQEHCHVGPLNEEQSTAMISLLNRIAVPILGKYPGEASAEDRAWFAEAVKPDYGCMLKEATDTIHKLRVAVTDASSI